MVHHCGALCSLHQEEVVFHSVAMCPIPAEWKSLFFQKKQVGQGRVPGHGKGSQLTALELYYKETCGPIIETMSAQ